jgi:hypothetical protein
MRYFLKSGVDPSLQARQLAAMRLEEAGTTFEAVAREWHGQQVSGRVPRHAADVLKSPPYRLGSCTLGLFGLFHGPDKIRDDQHPGGQRRHAIRHRSRSGSLG